MKIEAAIIDCIGNYRTEQEWMHSKTECTLPSLLDRHLIEVNGVCKVKPWAKP